jgi:hypothetical protein
MQALDSGLPISIPVFLADDAGRAVMDRATLLDLENAFLDALAPALDALTLVDCLAKLLDLAVEFDDLLLGI